MVTGLIGAEAADGFAALADACAAGGDERADFLVGKHFVETGFLGVDEFSAERKDRLKAAIATLFGGATGGVAFDDVKLGQRGIAFGAIGELAGEAAAGERAFAHGLAGFTRSFAGAGGVER